LDLSSGPKQPTLPELRFYRQQRQPVNFRHKGDNGNQARQQYNLLKKCCKPLRRLI
jgi:hypothetical protein